MIVLLFDKYVRWGADDIHAFTGREVYYWQGNFDLDIHKLIILTEIENNTIKVPIRFSVKKLIYTSRVSTAQVNSEGKHREFGNFAKTQGISLLKL